MLIMVSTITASLESLMMSLTKPLSIFNASSGSCFVCAQPYHFVPSGLFRLSASITSGAKGNSSSIRLFGRVGSFSKVSFNHAAEFKPLSFAAPNKV